MRPKLQKQSALKFAGRIIPRSGGHEPQVERIARKQFNNEQTPQLMGAKK
jgi:hypothetical protein